MSDWLMDQVSLTFLMFVTQTVGSIFDVFHLKNIVSLKVSNSFVRIN